MEEKKQVRIEDDKDGEITAQQRASVAPANPREFEAYMEGERAQFRSAFTDPAQLELFSMLPLPATARFDLLQKLHRDRDEARDRHTRPDICGSFLERPRPDDFYDPEEELLESDIMEREKRRRHST